MQHIKLALTGLRHTFTPSLRLLPIAVLLAACATTTPPSDQIPQASEPQKSSTSTNTATTAPASTPAQDTFGTLVTEQDRLYRVASPLLVNNSDLCRRNARNLLGFTAKNKYSFSSEYNEAAQKTLGLDERLKVTGVLAGSGAARAGLRTGDVLLSVENRPMPTGENAERQAATLLAPLVTGRSSVKLTVARDGAELPLTVPLTYACAFGIELGNTDNVVAYSDGHRVLVTRGMLNAVESDDELAYVLAKELAHSALAHASRMRLSATIGGIIDNLIRLHPDMSTMVGTAGVKPMPQDLDAMADKLALYMLVRARYPIDGVIPFWKRMANQYPPTMLNAYTALHPATDYRVAAMQKAIRDIKAKQAAKKPLLP